MSERREVSRSVCLTAIGNLTRSAVAACLPAERKRILRSRIWRRERVGRDLQLTYVCRRSECPVGSQGMPTGVSGCLA